MTKFSIEQDIKVCQDGGFFCEGCLIGKPRGELSPDEKHCKDCYDVLKQEVAVVGDKRLPIPLPDSEDIVSELPHKESIVTVVMKHKGGKGGRPRKQGVVSRVTQWRRKKGYSAKGEGKVNGQAK